MDMLMRNRMMMSRESEVDNVKEWKKILEYDFDESGKLPSPIDVSEYTDYYVYAESLINKSTTNDSSLLINIGDVRMVVDTSKSGLTAHFSQVLYGHYNGLFFEQYKVARFTNTNNLNYKSAYANIMRPYDYMLHPNISTMSFGVNASSFNIISGKVTIYAR